MRAISPPSSATWAASASSTTPGFPRRRRAAYCFASRTPGRPLLYRGSWTAPFRQEVSDRVKQAALDRFGFDANKPPDTQLHPRTLSFSYADPSLGACHAAVASVPIPGGWVSLALVKPKAPEQAQTARLSWAFTGLSAAAVLLLSIFWWFFVKFAIRPVEESRRRQMEFVSAASHELRAPLAVIGTSASVMRRASPEQADRFAQTISQECSRMSRLVDDMLMLASADNSSWSIQKEETDLETLLLDAAEWFEPAAAEKQIRISVSLPEETLPRCRCDQQRIRQVLSILVDNAVSYAGEGGRVVLSAGWKRGWFSIRVADDGPGIPDAEKARVFDRFYRADKARSGREHYGLGLSIAREIAALHRGRLTAGDTPGGGATFTLRCRAGIRNKTKGAPSGAPLFWRIRRLFTQEREEKAIRRRRPPRGWPPGGSARPLRGARAAARA